MTLTSQGAAPHEQRPDRPTTRSAAIVADIHDIAPEPGIDDWWRGPHWLAYAAGWDAGYAEAARRVNDAIAEAAAPLPWTAGEVVRRLVGDLGRETAQSTARAGAVASNGAGPARADDWPGIDALGRSERAAAYRRLIGSWDAP